MNGQCSPLPLSRALNHLFSTTAAQCESLLFRCATTNKSLVTTKKLHARCITSELLSNHFLSLLTSAYALCGHVPYACKLFDELPKRTVVAYNGMIQMYVSSGFPRMALEMFEEMHVSGSCLADHYTYPFVVRACGDLALLDLGKMVHGLIVRSGVGVNAFLGNSLLAMYMNCGDRQGAEGVFSDMEEKSVVAWNTMISGNFRNGSAKDALMIFRRMVGSGVGIDSATILSILPTCGYLKDLKAGKEVHKLVEESNVVWSLAVHNALIDMYVKCGRMDEARGVFDGMKKKDVVSWTSMINSYVLSGDAVGALELCRLMISKGVKPSEITLALLLTMCGNSYNLRLGKCLHSWAIRHFIVNDVNVETSLIDLYAKCNSFHLSFRLFSKTCRNRTVPWNAVLSGCLLNNLVTEAVELFKQMLLEGVKLDDATWKSLLPAYAIQANLHQAMNIHCYVIRSGFIRKPDIITGLMDIYSKSGNLLYAHKLFDTLSWKCRDIVSWSVIIAGYGKHGHGDVAISLFKQMVQSGVKPNEVTLTSVLHACGHAGLVDEGFDLFIFMQKNHKQCLRSEHYTCIVDLLGRANRLDKAYEVMKNMPGCDSCPAVWGALLGSCVIHENVELGEVAAKKLFKLEPANTGNYVLMGNIYSAVGRFDDAEKLRLMMDDIGLVKAPASSLIQLR